MRTFQLLVAALTLTAAGAWAQGKLVRQAKPVYPESARQAGISGTVKTAATVAPDGSVRSVRVLEGPEALAQAALDAVRQWQYEPTLVDGQAVAVMTSITMKFELPGSIAIQDTVGGGSGVKVVQKVRPVYPPEAKANHVQGDTLLRVLVGKDGTVKNVQVMRGEPVLAAAAQDAVKQWTYEPTLLDQKPVEVLVDVHVNFTLSQ